MRSFKLLLAACCMAGVLSACGSRVSPGDVPSADGTDVSATDTPGLDVPPTDADPCPTGRTRCAGACVDLASDPAHCGGCGAACTSGMTCNAGACSATCTAPRTLCGSPAACVDTNTDLSHCGGCGNACAMGQTCNTGRCEVSCMPPQRSCTVGGTPRCVDVSSDPMNCGACGMACPMDTPCTSGACGCNAPFQMCGASCVNTASDAAHCGRCGNLCAGGTMCAAGVCRCGAGQAFCGGSCIDVQTDLMNCGACNNVCARGLTCMAGSCICAAPRRMCGAACTDVMVDRANCGSCGNTCAGGTVCTSGSCVCPTGTVVCSGVCTDTMTDRNHCSACGRACPMNQVCMGGMCTTGVDVMLVLGNTGSNAGGLGNARMVLPMRLVAPLLMFSSVNIGVAASAEFPTLPYGNTGDRPFEGFIEPTRDATMINAAIMRVPTRGGGDAADSGIEGLAPLAGLPLHPTSTALTCSAGRVAGGCWRPGARRIVVFLTDDIFHNGPEPAPMGSMLYMPYAGIMPAPATWPEVLMGFRASTMTLLFMNSNMLGPRSPGGPQHVRMLADLGQPATDDFDSGDLMRMQTAADALVARVRMIAGL